MSQSLVELLTKRALDFYEALPENLQKELLGPFDDPVERCEWAFWPYWVGKYQGLRLSQLDEKQYTLLFRMLAVSLQRHAFAAAATSQGAYEKLTHERESATERGSPVARSSFNFRVTFWGKPDAKGTWGFRFQGHHVSINYTIVKGEIISATPTFLGANPGRVEYNGYQILRPLGYLEDYARELLFALKPAQRARAIVSEVPPYDNVLYNSPLPELPGRATVRNVGSSQGPYTKEAQEQWMETLRKIDYNENKPMGLSATDMTKGQRELFGKLVSAYFDWLPEGVLKNEVRDIEKAHFAWAGPREPRMAHYYRLQSSNLLVEYDNARNELAQVVIGDEANHVHAVLRHPRNDFGAGILGRHYVDAHMKAGKHAHGPEGHNHGLGVHDHDHGHGYNHSHDYDHNHDHDHEHGHGHDHEH